MHPSKSFPHEAKKFMQNKVAPASLDLFDHDFQIDLTTHLSLVNLEVGGVVEPEGFDEMFGQGRMC